LFVPGGIYDETYMVAVVGIIHVGINATLYSILNFSISYDDKMCSNLENVLTDDQDKTEQYIFMTRTLYSSGSVCGSFKVLDS
jgi:hypothetical protein